MEITFTLHNSSSVRIIRSGILSAAANSDHYSITEDGWKVNDSTFFSKTQMVEVERNGLDCYLSLRLEFLRTRGGAKNGKLILHWDHTRVTTKRVARLVRYITRKGVENPAIRLETLKQAELDALIEWVGTLQ
jgi:hypothetical protein